MNYLLKQSSMLLISIQKQYFILCMLVIWVTFWSMCSSCANKGTQQSQRCFQRHQYNCLQHNLWGIFTCFLSVITKVVINVYHVLNDSLVHHMPDHNPHGKTIFLETNSCIFFVIWNINKDPEFLERSIRNIFHGNTYSNETCVEIDFFLFCHV